MLALMEKFQTDFGLKLSILVFGITEQLPVTLKKVNTRTNDCFAAVNLASQGLNRHRSDEMFKTYLKLVKHKAEDKCNPTVLPWKWKLPRGINNGGDGLPLVLYMSFTENIILRLLTA